MPASDGADYLKTIPGFSAVRNGGVNGDPVFRGMFGSRLKLLSMAVKCSACPNRMDSPSSYISPDTFDKLTVIKGPQTVLWGPGASAATVLFEREPEQFSKPDYRINGSLLTASNGRFDRNLDAAAGNSQGYARLMANSSQADDYADGNGDTVPSRYDKWNTDVALGWTPDEDTLVEFTAGRGDGFARYAGRGMDGSQFQRESLGLRFEKTNIGESFYGLEAQVYYNYADHIMDNYSLRDFVPSMMMPNPTLSRVDRRTLGGRLVGTWQWTDVELKAGVDAQRSEHRKVMNPAGAANQMVNAAGSDALPWVPDAMLHSYGVFGELSWQLGEREKLISGLRLDLHEATDERAFSVATILPACPSSRATGTTPLPARPVATRCTVGSYATRKNWSACRRPGMPASAMPNASPTTGSCSSPTPARWAPCSRSTRYARKRPRSWTSVYSTPRGRWRPGFPPMPAWSKTTSCSAMCQA